MPRADDDRPVGSALGDYGRAVGLVAFDFLNSIHRSFTFPFYLLFAFSRRALDEDSRASSRLVIGLLSSLSFAPSAPYWSPTPASASGRRRLERTGSIARNSPRRL